MVFMSGKGNKVKNSHFIFVSKMDNLLASLGCGRVGNLLLMRK